MTGKKEKCSNKNHELIAPAGSFEKLKIAIQYGADTVYLGDKRFSLRTGAENFSIEDIERAVEYTHKNGKRVFVTINTFAHNKDIAEAREYISILKDLVIDGIVVSDPGIFTLIREADPDIKIHISTQSNTLNYKTVEFWEKQGATRIILARELTYDEILKIRERTCLELEVFVHGAMCMAYSGRCLLSIYLTGRDANKGNCAHPCRYNYSLEEEMRPGRYFPIEEDGKGTYILSSKDLCTIDHIHKFLKMGINGLKIEGRMKGIYYLAVVTKTYRQAINEYLKDPGNYSYDPEWKKELDKISHRKYTSGFYFEEDMLNVQNDSKVSYVRDYQLVGEITEKSENDRCKVNIKNKISSGDEIEVVTPGENIPFQKVERFYDEKGNVSDVAQPNQIKIIELKGDLYQGCLLRKKRKQETDIK